MSEKRSINNIVNDTITNMQSQTEKTKELVDKAISQLDEIREGINKPVEIEFDGKKVTHNINDEIRRLLKELKDD